MSELSKTFQKALKDGRLEDCLEIIDELLAETDDPIEQARIHHQVGTLAWNKSRPDISLEHYSRAAELLEGIEEAKAFHFTVLLDLGLVRYDAGRHSEALRAYEQARRVDPGDSPIKTRDLTRRLALVYMDEGRFAEADVALGKTPAADAEIDEVFAWTNYCLLLAERTGDIENAQVHSTALQDLWADHGHLPEIRRKAGAILTALRVDAMLRGSEEVEASFREIAKIERGALALNTMARLDILTAELFLEKGDPDAALAHLDASIARFLQVHQQLPMDMLVTRWSILGRLNRSHEFLSHLDSLLDGKITDGSLEVEAFTAELSPLLIALLKSPQLKDDCPVIFQRGLTKLCTLAFAGMPIEDRWEALSLLGQTAEHPKSKILFTKLACGHIGRTATTALSFSSARSTYMKARLAPFETAVARLYDAERLQEAQQIAAFADKVKSRFNLAIPLPEDDASVIPMTAEEEDVLKKLRASEPGAHKAVLDGSIWLDPPGMPGRELSATTALPILRLAKTDRGYRAELTAKDQSITYAIRAGNGELARLVSEVLVAVESNTSPRQPAARLHDLVLGEIGPLIKDIDLLAIAVEGVFASLPFDVLGVVEAMPKVLYLRGTSPAKQVSCGSSTLLIGDRRLEGVQDETESLERFTDCRKAGLTEVSLSNALASARDVLHVSGHFHLVPGHAAKTGIIGDDGAMITMHKLLALVETIDAAPPGLVFLSLCDSAVSDHANNTQIDLPEVFVRAGATFVIASAWKISDHDAARFASAFYRHFASGDDVRSAFFQAVLDTGFSGFKLIQNGLLEGMAANND